MTAIILKSTTLVFFLRQSKLTYAIVSVEIPDSMSVKSVNKLSYLK